MVFAGYNWFLIIVAVVVSLLAIAVAVYILITYQHPEDKNQAWLPKIVVAFGVSLSIWTVLLFPLDVGNQKACTADVVLSTCQLVIPTKALWYACYIGIGVMVALVIPFSIFYYEADSELSAGKQVVSACIWAGLTLFVFAIVFGLAYGFAGYVQFSVTSISSGMAPLSALAAAGGSANSSANNTSNSTFLDLCIFPGTGLTTPRYAGLLCDAVNGQAVNNTWTLRASLLTYFMALTATIGWFFFLVFAGVGFVALPMDLVREWWARPRATIARSEYITRAMDMAKKAKSVKDKAAALKQEERDHGRGRKWRAQLRRLNNMISLLEEDNDKLEKVFPQMKWISANEHSKTSKRVCIAQGTDPDYMWAVIVMLYWLKLVGGICTGILSILWLVHVVLYVFLSPPLYPFLNTFFSAMDRVFPLFGTLAFAIFCFYLIAVTMKGTMKVGLNLLVTSIHPMKVGGTLMSSMLFNVALMLLACLAVIQFCAQAFSLYAYNTAVYQIFTDQVLNLRGLGWLYQQAAFLYAMYGIVGLSILWFAIKGPEPFKRRHADDIYKE